jgi:hypothetical protein
VALVELAERTFEASSHARQALFDFDEPFALARQLTSVRRVDRRKFAAMVPEVDSSRTDSASEREHAARHEGQAPPVCACQSTLSLELDSVRVLTFSQLACHARLGFDARALDFGLAHGCEPYSLFAFRARAFRELLLTNAHGFGSLAGKPFGRFGSLGFTAFLTQDLGVVLALHALALLAHQRFQRK